MQDGNHTTGEWELKIGEQIRAQRLRMNIEQTTLAGRAGVSLSALKHLESGQGANLKTLIRVLLGLGRVEWLSTLTPPIAISPPQMLSSKSQRLRARQKRAATDA
jgi:transcriptional regulator with XRE-family HTH domain